LAIKGYRELSAGGCVLHVIMWIKSAHDVILTPQATDTNEVSVEVRMVDYIVQCDVVCPIVSID